jgi:hypothetical protein
MLKFFLSGILAASLIALVAPQGPLITAIIAGLALAAIALEWQGKRQGRGRGKSKKSLPAMKTQRKV